MSAAARPTGPAAVVVGVDGAPSSRAPLRWAAHEAHRRGTGLRVVHAVPGLPAPTRAEREDGRAVLARARREAELAVPGLAVVTAATEQLPTDALLGAAGRAAVLVVGIGGYGADGALALSSVALDLAGRAPCPVVVVPRGDRSDRGGGRAVVVGVDAVAEDSAALTVAFREAERRGAPLVVVHARGGPTVLREHLTGREDAARTALQDRLTAQVAGWAYSSPGVAVTVRVVQASPVAALLSTAGEADLLVVGTRRRSAPVRALLGSTSRALVRRATVPVEVVGLDVALTADALGPRHVPPAAVPSGAARRSEHPHDPAELY